MQSARALRGTKRTCTSCGERFYDLDRDPIVCPYCGFAYAPSAFVRMRPAPVVAEVKPKPAVIPEEEDADIEIETVEIDDDGLVVDADDLDDDELPGVALDVDDEEEES